LSDLVEQLGSPGQEDMDLSAWNFVVQQHSHALVFASETVPNKLCHFAICLYCLWQVKIAGHILLDNVFIELISWSPAHILSYAAVALKIDTLVTTAQGDSDTCFAFLCLLRSPYGDRWMYWWGLLGRPCMGVFLIICFGTKCSC